MQLVQMQLLRNHNLQHQVKCNYSKILPLSTRPRRFYKRRADIVFVIHTAVVRTCMELFQRLVAPLVLKFGIHQEQAGRKGVSRREEEGTSGMVESQCS
jgi:hypothetical protein